MRILIALALLAAAPPTAMETMLGDLHAMDVRVAEMGHRLAVRGAPLCTRKVRRMRMLFEDAALYSGPEREAARRLYGLADFPVIVWPAELAGLEVRAIDREALGPADPKAPRDRIDAIEAALEGEAKSFLIFTLGRGHVLDLAGEQGCPSRIQLLPSRKHVAKADGEIVQISTAMVEQARDDDELAFLIAHEMAHNALGHADKLEQVGWRGKMIYLTEVEADCLAVRLMKAAGFDPLAAARFWARYGKKPQHAFLTDGTHMKTKARIAMLREEALKTDGKLTQ